MLSLEARKYICLLMLAGHLIQLTSGHGRLLEPCGRSSLWRCGVDWAPKNYNDNQLFCGGTQRQWEVNGGKCGICGDPWDADPRENEAGGKYATGHIWKTYTEGDVIDAEVEITADHRGWFEFRICPHNDTTPATQDCLDQHLLEIIGTEMRNRYYLHENGLPQQSAKHDLKLRLPPGLTCEQCILQWKYHTGNSWGCGEDGCCVGCGDVQEEFYGCADVAIQSRDTGQPITTKKAITTDTAPPITTQRTTKAPVVTPSDGPIYKATTAHFSESEENKDDSDSDGVTGERDTKLPMTEIPSLSEVLTKSKITTKAPSDAPTTSSDSGGSDYDWGSVTCIPTPEWLSTPLMFEWCRVNCARGDCPESYCVCYKCHRGNIPPHSLLCPECQSR